MEKKITYESDLMNVPGSNEYRLDNTLDKLLVTTPPPVPFIS